MPNPTPKPGPYTIPAVSRDSGLPFSILADGAALRSLDERRVLLSLFNATYRDITAFSPERMALQESAVSIATQIQITNHGGYDAQLEKLTHDLVHRLESSPDYVKKMEELRGRHQQIEARMAQLTADGKEFDPSKAHTPEEMALAKAFADMKQAEKELTAKGKLHEIERMIPEGMTKKDMIVQRASDILYEQVARREMGAYIQPKLDALVHEQHLSRITYHEPGKAHMAFILGGPASGKGTTVGDLEAKVTVQYGAAESDRILLNGDAFKPLFATQEHLTTHKYAQSQLLMDDAAIVKTRVLATVQASHNRPHMVLDQVFVGPNDPTMHLTQGGPKYVSVVATDTDVALQRSFGRGEQTGRYEHTEGTLSIHRNVSRDLVDRLNSFAGQDIEFTIVDGNNRPPATIMEANLKTGKIVIQDIDKLALFSGKKDINIKAQSATELFQTGTGKPTRNLEFLQSLHEHYSDIEIQHQGKPALRIQPNGQWHVADATAYDALKMAHPEAAALSHSDAHPVSSVATSRGAKIVNAANAPIGLAMGAKGLWDKLGDENSLYHQDVKAGGVRSVAAQAGLVGDGANFTVGAVDSVNGIRSVTKSASAAAETLEAASGASKALGVAGKIAGRAAIPIALAVGVAETTAAISAKDGHRATKAVGSTVGGILGGIAAGMATGAVIGSVIPGAGTLVGAGVGLVMGIGGALAGAHYGGEWLDQWKGDWADAKLKEPPKAPQTHANKGKKTTLEFGSGDFGGAGAGHTLLAPAPPNHVVPSHDFASLLDDKTKNQLAMAMKGQGTYAGVKKSNAAHGHEMH